MKATRNDYLNRRERLGGKEGGFETPGFSSVGSTMLGAIVAVGVLVAMDGALAR